MEAKEPVILTVMVDAGRQRWLLASTRLDGTVTPLLRSEDGDLTACQGLGFDDQVSFLRHRLCGVFQRGHDKVWPVGQKACQFVALFVGALPGASPELTPRIAEHFALWMLNPRVVAYATEPGPGVPDLHRLAGTIEPDRDAAFRAGLERLLTVAGDPAAWEVSTRKGTWQPGH